MLYCLIKFIGVTKHTKKARTLLCTPLHPAFLTTAPALTETGTLPDADVAVHMGNTINSLQFEISFCPGSWGRTVGG